MEEVLQQQQRAYTQHLETMTNALQVRCGALSCPVSPGTLQSERPEADVCEISNAQVTSTRCINPQCRRPNCRLSVKAVTRPVESFGPAVECASMHTQPPSSLCCGVKAGCGIWGLGHVFEGKLYFTKDIVDDSFVPRNRKPKPIPKPKTKPAPKPAPNGKHVQLSEMRRMVGKGFYATAPNAPTVRTSRTC